MAIKDDTNIRISTALGVYPQDVDNIVMGVGSLRDLHKNTTGRFVKGYKGAKGKKSIIGMAANNMFEFPVFVSKNVPLDYAESTCTLLEQVYASYIQMAISMDPIVDSRSLSKLGGGGGYLAKFKTNTTKYVEYVDYSEAPYAHEACHNVIDVGDKILEFDMISIDDEVGKMITEACEYEPLSEFDHFFTETKKDTLMNHDEFVDSWKTSHKDGSDADAEAEYEKYRFNHLRANDQAYQNLKGGKTRGGKEAQYQKSIDDIADTTGIGPDGQPVTMTYKNDIHNKRRVNAANADRSEMDIDPTYDEKGNVKTSYIDDVENKRLSNAAHAKKDQIDAGTVATPSEIEAAAKKAGTSGLSYDYEVANRRVKLGAERSLAVKNADRADMRWQMEKNKDAREKMARGPEMLDETKMRKLNSLKPLMMKVQIRVMNKDGDITEYPVELISGVKVHCRMIDPATLPDVAKFPLKEMNEITRKVKYNAGELKFKDLLFNIKEKKQTAIDSADPSKRWYRRLYQLAHMKGDSAVAKALTGNGTTGLMPNSAMIITNDDVENVKDSTNIDLLKGSTGCKFCKELFMMALVVIDQDADSIKMLTPDINSDYQVHSMATIRKQLAELDTAGTKTRDIFKLLG